MKLAQISNDKNTAKLFISKNLDLHLDITNIEKRSATYIIMLYHQAIKWAQDLLEDKAEDFETNQFCGEAIIKFCNKQLIISALNDDIYITWFIKGDELIQIAKDIIEYDKKVSSESN